MRFNDNNYEAAFIKAIVRNNYVSEINVEKRKVPFGARLLNQSTNYIPETDYYDSGTHEALGEYLRYIRDFYLVDLMSLYNCFSNRFVGVGTLPIKSDGSKTVFADYDEQFVTTCFPIKKNTTYRIYFKDNNTSTVLLQPGLFYNSNLIGNIVFDAEPVNSSAYEFTFKDIDKKNPRIPGGYENALFLFIKYNRNNVFPPVVIEVVDKKSFNAINNTLVNEINGEIAFSDTLLEYLSGNAISPFNTEVWDILRVQKMLEYLHGGFKYTPGIFDEKMHRFIFDEYYQKGLPNFLGYIDKNMEEIITRAWEAKRLNENSKSGG